MFALDTENVPHQILAHVTLVFLEANVKLLLALELILKELTLVLDMALAFVQTIVHVL